MKRSTKGQTLQVGRVTTVTVDRVDALWEKTIQTIQNRNGRSLDLWFQQIRDVKIDGRKIMVSVPNTFTKEWIKEKYEQEIIKEFKKLTAKNFEIHFSFYGKRTVKSKEPRGVGGAERFVKQKNPFDSSNVNEKFTFENFVEGPANQLAAAAAKMVSYEPKDAVSPIYIHAGTGLGKTHLLCAIHHARRQTGNGKGVIYISAESFLNQFIETLNSKNMKEFRDLYRKECTTLLIDDLQYLSAKQKTQEEFFHCFNELYNSGKTIVMACDRPPGQLEKVEETLRSRFEWGLVVDIQPLCFETRLVIVGKKSKAMGLDLPQDIAVKVAKYSRSNVREIEGILIRLQMQSKIKKVPITDELFKEVASNFSARTSIKVAMDDVIRHVAAAYGLKISDIRGERRHRTVALPRQVAMYICRESLRLSYPEIADRFGGKNHTTVIAACRKIKQLIKKDLALLSTVERLTGQLGLSEADATTY